MRGSLGVVLAGVIAGALGSGCTSEGTTTQPSDVPPPAATELVVNACTWRWFDRIDVGLEAPFGVPAGTEVRVRVSLYEGDVGSVSAGDTFALGGSGSVQMPVAIPRPGGVDLSDVRVSTSDAAPPAGSTCEVSVDGGARWSASAALPLGYDVQPPASDGSAIGELVAGVGSRDDAAFLLGALPRLFEVPPADVLYLAKGLVLDTIAVRRDGTCLTLATGYRIAAGAYASVQQSHGCLPGPADVQSTLALAGDGEGEWRVTTVGLGDDPHAAAAALTMLPLPGGESPDGPAVPAPDTWLDAHFAAHPEVVEVGRFPWGEGIVAVVRNEGVFWLDAYTEPLLAGTGSNLASTAQMCRG
jgi:hypothetical protein